MQKEKFLELVTRYLSNEATFSEKEKLSELLKNDEYNDLFVWISDNWQNINLSSNDNKFDVNRGLNKLTNKIKEYEPEFKWEASNKKVTSGGYRFNFIKVAASITFFIFLSISVIYFITNLNQEKKSSEITFNEKITYPGQKSIITLFDGTKITLNANSKLKYPTHFGDYSREVFLEGEAYFEVVHNLKKPFIVHTGKISTKVLGTKFNITAFPEENNIKVSLVEGKVVVSNLNEKKSIEKINLKPSQQYVYNIPKMRSKVCKFNILKEIGWKDNTFIFDNEPIENVLVKLERAFGVKLEINLPNKNHYKIKANFNNESFWAVIEAIKYVTELDYKIISNNNELEKVIFQKKKQ